VSPRTHARATTVWPSTDAPAGAEIRWRDARYGRTPWRLDSDLRRQRVCAAPRRAPGRVRNVAQGRARMDAREFFWARRMARWAAARPQPPTVPLCLTLGACAA